MNNVTGEDIKTTKENIVTSLVDIEIEEKNKFIRALERQEERVQECIDEIILILQEHVQKEILIQAVTQFENLQFSLITDKLKKNKNLTRNQIVTTFLAILDNLLSLIYEQLTPAHFELLRYSMEGLSEGKTFSYNTMKKYQINLIQEGYISKIRKLSYTLKLKDQYCQMLSHMMSIFPEYNEKLHDLEIEGYNLIHSKAIPKTDVKKSAVVVIGSLVSSYFEKKDEKQRIWRYLEDVIDEEEKQIMRKVYRFKSNLKKADF
ncbi:MAG: hypothetical protein ACXABK_00610 [Candidatus Heimdallarchaeaceae archaeon]|jgi:hypothetical protein